MEKVVRTCIDGSTVIEYWAETDEEQAEIDAMVARGEADGPSFADQRERAARRNR